MVRFEPVPGERAAVVTLGDERALVVADYHAGYEAGLRYERGVDVPSRAPARKERLLALLERTTPDRLVVLGDLMHSIGDPGGAERGELEVLFESLPPGLSVTVVKGNHDGAIETWLVREDDSGHDNRPNDAKSDGSNEAVNDSSNETVDAEATEAADDGANEAAGDGVTEAARDGTRRGGRGWFEVVPGDGVALDGLGVCHGHTWPAREVLESELLCLGHEHPCVRLEDEVGGSRVEPAWLRGRLDPTPFRARPEYEDVSWLDDGTPPELIVVPAFNDLVGGTWVNVEGQSFLSPFLPAGLAAGEVYLLDGTRLGSYDSI